MATFTNGICKLSRLHFIIITVDGAIIEFVYSGKVQCGWGSQRAYYGELLTQSMVGMGFHVFIKSKYSNEVFNGLFSLINKILITS